MQDPYQLNLIIAIVLSLGILVSFNIWFARRGTNHQPPVLKSSPIASHAGAQFRVLAPEPKAWALRRIGIETPRLRGSISLTGARIDDLRLADYFETIERKREVRLLAPAGTESAVYAEFGWTSDDPSILVPSPVARWTAADDKPLTPSHPVVLTWANGTGLAFQRTISVDANYMLRIAQRITNAGEKPVMLRPYATVTRSSPIPPDSNWLVYEGPIAAVDGTVQETRYQDLEQQGRIARASTGGWIGFTDKYWLVAVIPAPYASVEQTLRHGGDGVDQYEAGYLDAAVAVPPNGIAETNARLFAGAKEVELLAAYEREGVPRLSEAVDWGRLWFLTRPFFYALDFLGKALGNFGLGIMAFTVFLRVLLFPLTLKSARQMHRMKNLAPHLAALRERHAENAKRLQAETAGLYKREKVNLLSGCLPLLIQPPIFFALYKVLLVTIEMRQAPFFGWIHDLSAPDPTSLFSLFGLLPVTPPDFLLIGAWPLILGLTVFLQQRVSAAPGTRAMATTMAFAPAAITVWLARYPVGLVIYWAWSNLLSAAQQVLLKWWLAPTPQRT
jgi:YidC/Oxa1 family membrane protein insertase